MFEHSVYSVISPEGCASILWGDKAKTSQAANALCITANDLLKFNVIDEIIREPLGGAHRNHKQAAIRLKKSLRKKYAQKPKKKQSQPFFIITYTLTRTPEKTGFGKSLRVSRPNRPKSPNELPKIDKNIFP